MSDTKADTQATDQGRTEDQEETPGGSGDSGRPEPGTDGEGQGESDESEEEEETPSAEAYKKLEAKANRREAKLREAQARIKELEGAQGAKEGDGEEDPEARANQKLIRASARTALASAGITDRAAQGSILELINLSDIEVDASGDPDEEEISERIETLRKALGAVPEKPGRRTPAGRTAADRGGSGGAALTPDQKRWRAFLNS